MRNWNFLPRASLHLTTLNLFFWFITQSLSLIRSFFSSSQMPPQFSLLSNLVASALSLVFSFRNRLCSTGPGKAPCGSPLVPFPSCKKDHALYPLFLSFNQLFIQELSLLSHGCFVSQEIFCEGLVKCLLEMGPDSISQITLIHRLVDLFKELQ